MLDPCGRGQHQLIASVGVLTAVVTSAAVWSTPPEARPADARTVRCRDDPHDSLAARPLGWRKGHLFESNALSSPKCMNLPRKKSPIRLTGSRETVVQFEGIDATRWVQNSNDRDHESPFGNTGFRIDRIYADGFACASLRHARYWRCWLAPWN